MADVFELSKARVAWETHSGKGPFCFADLSFESLHPSLCKGQHIAPLKLETVLSKFIDWGVQSRKCPVSSSTPSLDTLHGISPQKRLEENVCQIPFSVLGVIVSKEFDDQAVPRKLHLLDSDALGTIKPPPVKHRTHMKLRRSKKRRREAANPPVLHRPAKDLKETSFSDPPVLEAYSEIAHL